MHIAQIAPLWETIPPRSYGGTELVVHLLTENLVKMGHEVTLFAAAPSKTAGRLIQSAPYPLRDLPQHYPAFKDQPLSFYPGSTISSYTELQMLENIASMAGEFDVIHNHLGSLTLPFAKLWETPTVTTLHGPFREASLQDVMEGKFYAAHADLKYVSISDYQRIPGPKLDYVDTVYHGLDASIYPYDTQPENKNYLAFLGRFCHDKGPHIAIQAALKNNKRLLMAGKIDADDEKVYFKNQIEPFIDGDQIQYIGELNHTQKVEFLKNAEATLCPVLWPEPFGLVLIESLACGTPVLALRAGSIPEIITHGKTGFVLNTPEELVAAVAHIQDIRRTDCREEVETRFTAQLMAQNYIEVYQKLIQHPLSPHRAEVTRLDPELKVSVKAMRHAVNYQ